MEDFDETLYLVWRANLNVLAGSPAGGARIARMMSFSPSYMKLILAGRRDFSEEFVRGVETVTGLPPRWLDERRDRRDIPLETQRAMDEETPAAVFPAMHIRPPSGPCCVGRNRSSPRRRRPGASPTRHFSRWRRIGATRCSGATATCC